MSLSKGIRQVHRWLAITFTLAVLLNFALFGQEPYPLWLGVVTLLPLALLLFTGLYLFVLPYAAGWRRRRETSG